MTNKKYETPQVNVVEMQTAPLLAGSDGNVPPVEAEDATWS